MKRSLAVVGIGTGVGIFVVGASLQSEVALVGIATAGAVAVAFTWTTIGPKAVWAGLVGALAGSVVAWVAMRSMMRWVALTSDISPVLTAGGSAAILASSVVLGLLPGMGYVHFRRRLGGSFPKAALFGAVLSLIGGVPLTVVLSGEISSIAREPAIPVAFLLIVPIVFALTLEASHRWLDARLPAPKSLN